MENCLLFGLGGIGAVYSLILKTSKQATVSVVARSNFEVVKKKGLTIKSPDFGQQHLFFDEVYSTSPDTTNPTHASPFSYILVSSKALQTAVPSLPTLLEPFVTPKFTTIVLIQNGIGIEDQVAERWPDNTIISCITWVGASQPQPGIIEHSNGLETTLGLFDPPKRSVAFDGHQQENLINLVKMLQAGGADVHEKEDIQTERWKKVIWNAAWNSLTTLTDLDTSTYLASSSTAPALARSLMREMINIAQRLGLKVPDNQDDILMARVSERPLNSSMRMDCQAKRPMELEVILGNPLRKAKALGMETPVLETLYTILLAIDLRNTGKITSKF